MIKIFQLREATAEQILRSEEKNKSKRAGLRESLSGVLAVDITMKSQQNSPGL